MNNQIKVGMLILMQHDIEKSVEFYKKIGFPVKFHLKDNWAEFMIGQIKLGLCPTSTEPFDRHTGIVLEVDDINSLQEFLKGNGIEFIMGPKSSVHGIMASIKDPSGNIMDVYQPTPENVQDFIEKVAKTDKSESDEN